MTTFLYTLNCPATGEVRYLGKSDNPFKRFGDHICKAACKKSHKNSWILSLRAQGLAPTMDLLDEVPTSEWQFWEREYIRVFRAIGIKLTNLADGGEGGVMPLEVRQKIGAKSRSRKHTLAARQKMSAARIGKSRSSEMCRKLSASRKGIKFSLEHCANISAAKKHKPWSTARRAAC